MVRAGPASPGCPILRRHAQYLADRGYRHLQLTRYGPHSQALLPQLQHIVALFGQGGGSAEFDALFMGRSQPGVDALPDDTTLKLSNGHQDAQPQLASRVVVAPMAQREQGVRQRESGPGSG